MLASGRTALAAAIGIAALCSSRPSQADEGDAPAPLPAPTAPEPPREEEAPKPTPMKPLPPPSALAPPHKATRWYGWQTLLLDAAAAGLMIGSVVDSRHPDEGALSLLAPTRFLKDPPEHTAFIDASLAFYTLAPAFVHAVHERGVQAALSPVIRLGAPTLGTLTGAVYGFAFAVVVLIFDDRSSFGRDSAAETVFIGGIASGYALGFLAPVFIDAAIFGREPIDPADDSTDKKAAARRAPPTIQWMPRLGMSKDGPTFNLGGTF